MAGEPKRMASPQATMEIAALIEKRLAQGLPKTVIASRLGIGKTAIAHYLERAAKLAKASHEPA